MVGMMCLLGAAASVFSQELNLAVSGIIVLLTGWPLYRLGHRLFGGKRTPDAGAA